MLRIIQIWVILNTSQCSGLSSLETRTSWTFCTLIVRVHRTAQMPLSLRPSLTVSPQTDASFATLYPTLLFWLPNTYISLFHVALCSGPREPQEEAIQAAFLAVLPQCGEHLLCYPDHSVTSVQSAKVHPVDRVASIREGKDLGN